MCLLTILVIFLFLFIYLFSIFTSVNEHNKFSFLLSITAENKFTMHNTNTRIEDRRTHG